VLSYPKSKFHMGDLYYLCNPSKPSQVPCVLSWHVLADMLLASLLLVQACSCCHSPLLASLPACRSTGWCLHQCQTRHTCTGRKKSSVCELASDRHISACVTAQ
jgi:hypothetical protein